MVKHSKLKGAVILGKAKYDSLTGKSIIRSTISQFDPHMSKIL